MTTTFLAIKFTNASKLYCHGMSEEKQRFGQSHSILHPTPDPLQNPIVCRPGVSDTHLRDGTVSLCTPRADIIPLTCIVEHPDLLYAPLSKHVYPFTHILARADGARHVWLLGQASGHMFPLIIS